MCPPLEHGEFFFFLSPTRLLHRIKKKEKIKKKETGFSFSFCHHAPASFHHDRVSFKVHHGTHFLRAVSYRARNKDWETGCLDRVYSSFPVRMDVGDRKTLIDLHIDFESGHPRFLLPFFLFARIFSQHGANGAEFGKRILALVDVIFEEAAA